MGHKEIILILQETEEFKRFVRNNPEYDMVIKNLDSKDLTRIQEEFPKLNLFPNTLNLVVAITLISRVLMQNGYPKFKAYINMEKREILHVFLSN